MAIDYSTEEGRERSGLQIDPNAGSEPRVRQQFARLRDTLQSMSTDIDVARNEAADAQATADAPAWTTITGTPTTIAGYGIADSITLTSSSLPPTGAGTVGKFHEDVSAHRLYWGEGSAWYYTQGTLYTPSTTPGEWDFSDSVNSGQIVTVGF